MRLLSPLLLFLTFHTHADLVHSHQRDEIIQRNWYSLSYNEEHEVANWVAYSLDSSQLRNCVNRSNSFRPDPQISTGSAILSDYRNSGYDRGHLVPAGDMKFERQAMRDTFYLSNITPQPAFFNRGRWGQLEYLLRAWIKRYGKLWIVTGPILKNSLSWVGDVNQVSVPEEYFKVVIRKEKNTYKGIGFLMHTQVPYPDLAAYALDIDTIEELSGHNFFPFLTSREERQAEGKFQSAEWDFTARFDYLPCEPSAAQ